MRYSVPSSLDIPVIETERLKLRGHTIEDAPKVRALWSDPQVTRYIGGQPLTAEECWSRLLRYVGHWSLLGYGYWVLEEKATGDFVGEVGFSDCKRDVEPTIGAVPEVGWVLIPPKHGVGYATEAVHAVLDWGHEHFGPSSVVCLIHPDHHASIHVAQKCGFKRQYLGTYRGRPMLVFDRVLQGVAPLET
jgi:RimJ/RimL family protein N-acetyltransferase